MAATDSLLILGIRGQEFVEIGGKIHLEVLHNDSLSVDEHMMRNILEPVLCWWTAMPRHGCTGEALLLRELVPGVKRLQINQNEVDFALVRGISCELINLLRCRAAGGSEILVEVQNCW